ncbi:MAG: signal peptidase I [bacterium]|nr:signal peptidase I [bacterium]
MGVLRSAYNFVLDITETIVIALAIFVVIYLFAVQPHEVKGDSMLPNFVSGEYLLTNKITYRFHEPQRGDVIVFKFPLAQQFDYIKRIIALPNDEIMLQDNQVTIYNSQHPNGLALKELYLKPGTIVSGRSFLPEGKRLKIPEGEYFVMGDNRERSSDSREWGFVPRELIIGRSWVRYWPTQALAFIPSQTYEENKKNP